MNWNLVADRLMQLSVQDQQRASDLRRKLEPTDALLVELVAMVSNRLALAILYGIAEDETQALPMPKPDTKGEQNRRAASAFVSGFDFADSHASKGKKRGKIRNES